MAPQDKTGPLLEAYREAVAAAGQAAQALDQVALAAAAPSQVMALAREASRGRDPAGRESLPGPQDLEVYGKLAPAARAGGGPAAAAGCHGPADAAPRGGPGTGRPETARRGRGLRRADGGPAPPDRRPGAGAGPGGRRHGGHRVRRGQLRYPRRRRAGVTIS